MTNRKELYMQNMMSWIYDHAYDVVDYFYILYHYVGMTESEIDDEIYECCGELSDEDHAKLWADIKCLCIGK